MMNATINTCYTVFEGKTNKQKKLRCNSNVNARKWRYEIRERRIPSPS